MENIKAWVVCVCETQTGYDEEKGVAEYDARIYYGYVDARNDYADYIVGAYKTAADAHAAAEAELAYRRRAYPADNTYIY